ncbi:MAG: UvrD-helicase domain-containing protein [Candidatus Methanoplasma sp.]|jgi:ATP-dependent exoDNAse (exonuclease V) beta subunit|nr:UvrD-helicase domain-containing protein [Candidatus Methanoplasma sp.]
MSELNPSQRRIAEALDGMVVVDAGPGTGKTHTIVDRYMNIISRDGVSASDVLLLTFTRNAAAEMEERIRERMGALGLSGPSKLVQSGTFDSLCHAIVMESPESVSRFFRVDEKLSRGAAVSENETLNRVHFSDFLDGFMADRGEDYGDDAAIAESSPGGLYDLICRLMSRGIAPLRSGWFGGDGGKALLGDPGALLGLLSGMNGGTDLSKDLCERMRGERWTHSADPLAPLPEEMLREAAFEDRGSLLALVHDVYHAYIARSIADDRLTFGLTSLFAFVALYSDGRARERMSHRYVMIDEFQDTNETQMMIALMLLKEPNLCAVGDWKQGIYGFRHADVGNMIEFEARMVRLRKALNDDSARIPFHIPEASRMTLDVSYRSSQEVIDAAYGVLFAPATKEEALDAEALSRSVSRISAGRSDIGGFTGVEFSSSPTREGEAAEVARRIAGYVSDPRYMICEGESRRRPGYGDIAVLCRNGGMCREVAEAAASLGIPAFLQGDVEIMRSREGKLALAWLRYVNSPGDPWGLGAILADLGHPLAEIRRMLADGPPPEVSRMRSRLLAKRRRITDLLTAVFSFYGLNNDVTQAITSVIASAHRESLMTISDVIGMIEKDMEDNTKYGVDGMLDGRAVTVQTMHKSKGLEYPIVIIAGVDQGVMPSVRGDSSLYPLSPLGGVRCRKAVFRREGHAAMAQSWRTRLAMRAAEADYGEERRLMFVAISRAKQYVSLVSGPRPSLFFKSLSKGAPEPPRGEGPPLPAGPPAPEAAAIPRPATAAPAARRVGMPVHAIMRFAGSGAEDRDEAGGKGAEYGTMVHEAAYAMAMGVPPRSGAPELERIREILSSLEGADLLPEMECSLPVEGLNVTLRGTMDLLAVYPDRAVVYDYKTDSDKSNLGEYMVQLSAYAHAASGHFKRRAECVVEYVSLGESVRFQPLGMEEIAGRVREALEEDDGE